MAVGLGVLRPAAALLVLQRQERPELRRIAAQLGPAVLLHREHLRALQRLAALLVLQLPWERRPILGDVAGDRS